MLREINRPSSLFSQCFSIDIADTREETIYNVGKAVSYKIEEERYRNHNYSFRLTDRDPRYNPSVILVIATVRQTQPVPVYLEKPTIIKQEVKQNDSVKLLL